MSKGKEMKKNQVINLKLGQALMHYAWCPYIKGKFGHRDRQREKGDDMKRPRENTMGRWRQIWELCCHKPRDVWGHHQKLAKQGRTLPSGGSPALPTR